MTNEELVEKVKSLIVNLRRDRDTGASWRTFSDMIDENIDQVCESFDSRWLISICDTYVDYGDPVSSRNAMLIVQITNFEKLWATNLLMYDVTLNKEKEKILTKHRVVHLWDGMYSMNINHGDMVNNLFNRMNALMAETPVLEKIYYSVLDRMKQHGTTLANLDKYHAQLFSPFPRRSVTQIIIRKIRRFSRRYKL